MIDIAQPLKVFSDSGKDLRTKQNLRNWINYPSLYIPPTSLIPFVVQREKSVEDIGEWFDMVKITSVIADNVITGKQTNLTSYLTFDYGVRSLSDTAYEFALFRANDAIPSGTLKQGKYQLIITDEDANVFYTEVFRIWKPDITIKFEFRNSFSFNDMWFFGEDFYFEMEFEGATYSKQEYLEFLNTISDINNHIGAKTKQVKDEILMATFRSDKNITEAIELMDMCDEIYITDELGNRNKIEILDISTDEVTKGGHSVLSVEFRIIENMKTRTENSISYIGSSKGGDAVSKQTGIFLGAKFIMIGGKKIKIR